MWRSLVNFMGPAANGRISLDNWLAFHEAALSTPQGYLAVVNGTAELVLSAVDSDNDGALSKSEWGAFFRPTASDTAQLDMVYRRLDADGDNEIDREEVLQLVGDFFTSDDPEARGNWLLGAY